MLGMVQEQPVELGIFVLGLLFLVAARIRKLSRRVVLPVLSCFVVGYLCFCRYGTAEGILAHYGVHYDNDPDSPPFASSSLNAVRFWFDGPQGRLWGPTLDGDAIFVEKPYRTSDGHLEFVVRSRVYPDGPTRIQVILPPEGKMAFRVVEVGRLVALVYPLQPEISFP